MHTVLTGRACPTQERFYFLDRLQPGNPAHVVGFALRLEGALHPEVLAEAVHRTVARHDVLRTSYTVEDGLVMQHVRPDSDAAVDVRSSRSSDRESQERELRELVADQAGQPFSLEEGPILRAFIRSWNPDEHGLVVLVHHIACDGWANPILMSDIAAYYNAAVTGPGETAGPAGTAPSHFAYSQAQRDVRNRGGIDFWRKTLQDAPHLSLHTDFPRPSELSDQGALVRLPVEPELIRQLTEWATGRGVTFFAVVLAAYASVLSRYARQDRVVIGVPVANRLNTDEEGLVGCLANTLPVLVDLTGSPPFADLLSRVWTAWLNAFGHQDVPFDLIVQAVQADRQLSQLPVFQTALNVLNYPFSLPDFDGLDVTEVDVQIEAAGFDVAITVDLCAATPFLRLDYRPELFEPPTAATMLSHYLAFLRSIVADAGAEPTMVNEAERDCLLVAANPPAAVGEPAQPSVLARFGEWARTSPDAVAIRHRGRDTTYRELDEWSSRIAAALLDAGVSGGDLVGLLLRRSPAVIASILGAWKAGAAYVPLDPEYPPYRLNLMVGSVGLTAMLAEAETADMARGLTGNQAVDLINVREISSQSEVPAACPAAGDLAYVMYTSGSTGTPKGVRVRHAGLSALYSPTPAGLDITASDVWLCTHSFSFDASVWATLGALTTGGRLVIAGYAQQADPARLAALVQTEKVTVLDATSGILYRLLPPYLDLLGGDVSPIRYVTTGGEALSWSRLAALVASTENFQPVFVNLYGLTECTIITTACQVAAKDLASVRDGTIGLPVPSARCYVLDNRLRPAGRNVPGELYVGGACVGDGYVNDKELSAERFLPDPYGPGVMYKTGDLVKWATDGTIVFLGRDDTQVKLRGYRVECADVEAALLRHPDVRSCSVLADEGELFAFICADLGPDAESRLRAYLRGLLPGYMVPSRILAVPEIPLNAHGKVDTSRLLAEGRKAGSGRDPGAPGQLALGTELEERICGLWRTVLRREDVSLNDNFFDLGGNSLTMMELQQLMVAHGLDVTVSDLFRFGTVAGCARHFEQGAPTAPSTVSAERRRQGRQLQAARRRAAGGGNA